MSYEDNWMADEDQVYLDRMRTIDEMRLHLPVWEDRHPDLNMDGFNKKPGGRGGCGHTKWHHLVQMCNDWHHLVQMCNEWVDV